jgi:lambda family phage portal protein
VLRERSRFERDNNSYCQGMTLTMAGDLIGTGPRLQLLTDDEDLNDFFERAFGNWAESIDLAGKLQLLDLGAIVDGEGFALLVDNPELWSISEVTLDLKVIECDLVTEDTLGVMAGRRPGQPVSVDGIRFDKVGNPVEYRVLREHPGDGGWGADADWLPSAQVLHWFRPLRAGQVRGIPETTPALPLFAQLRRYSLAVLMAAELAAELAAFIQTELPPDGNADAIDPMDVLEIVRGMITTLPAGWSINQLRPEQPITGYAEYVGQVIREIARCFELPFGIAAGDSSTYNYASGRLDVQVYQRKVTRRRMAMKVRLLNRLWRAWMDEATTVKTFRSMMAGNPPWIEWGYTWIWDGFEHVDPSKEAQALATLLGQNGATLADWYASKGKDWREQLRQRAKERTLQNQLGLSDAAAVGQTMPAGNAADGNADQVPTDGEAVPA